MDCYTNYHKDKNQRPKITISPRKSRKSYCENTLAIAKRRLWLLTFFVLGGKINLLKYI